MLENRGRRRYERARCEATSAASNPDMRRHWSICILTEISSEIKLGKGTTTSEGPLSSSTQKGRQYPLQWWTLKSYPRCEF